MQPALVLKQLKKPTRPAPKPAAPSQVVGPCEPSPLVEAILQYLDGRR